MQTVTFVPVNFSIRFRWSFTGNFLTFAQGYFLIHLLFVYPSESSSLACQAIELLWNHLLRFRLLRPFAQESNLRNIFPTNWLFIGNWTDGQGFQIFYLAILFHLFLVPFRVAALALPFTSKMRRSQAFPSLFGHSCSSLVTHVAGTRALGQLATVRIGGQVAGQFFHIILRSSAYMAAFL